MQLLRDRRWFWTVRYTGLFLVAIALGLAFLGLIFFRPWVEPVVRAAFIVLALRSGVTDVPNDPRYYMALTGLLFVTCLGTTLYALLTHRRVDRKVDRYLADRLPRHEIELERKAGQDS